MSVPLFVLRPYFSFDGIISTTVDNFNVIHRHKKNSAEAEFFKKSVYFNNKLLMRFTYAAGSSGKPPSAITA